MTITHKSFEFNHEIEWLDSETGGFYLKVLSPQMKRYSLRNPFKGCYRFSTSEARDAYIASWRIKQQAKVNIRLGKKQRKEELLKTFVNPYKVGDILHSSWGYDQTNVEWFQVVEVKARSICIRQIGAKITEYHSSMSGTSRAQPDNFIGERIWRTLQFSLGDEKLHVGVCSPIHGYLYTDDGKLEHHVSWYA